MLLASSDCAHVGDYWIASTDGGSDNLTSAGAPSSSAGCRSFSSITDLLCGSGDSRDDPLSSGFTAMSSPVGALNLIDAYNEPPSAY